MLVASDLDRMNRQPFDIPPRWWSPKPSVLWMRAWRPLRRFHQLRRERILEVKVRGLDFVRGAMTAGHGVLVTPNHAGHGDCYLLWEAIDRLHSRCYVMTAWQVFQMAKGWERLLYRQHGCFSINREGTDLQAFRQAVQVLAKTSYPLVIFPEGEVYHLNERVTPFREGTGSIALSAVKRGGRPVTCIPCALRYYYVRDPRPELEHVMGRLEERVFWRASPHLTLSERIVRFADGTLQLKELEYLGHRAEGSLTERTNALADVVLSRLEAHYGVATRGASTPERVKELRHQVIERRRQLSRLDPAQADLSRDLDDLFFVVQLFSYPGDYVTENPTIERMAETIDKFEEDFLGAPTARIRGTRRATVTFGQPVVIERHGAREGARRLTRALEDRVQQLLDEPAPAAALVSA